MSDQEPWQRRVRRSDGSIDPVGPGPLNPPAASRDSGSVARSRARDQESGRRSRDEWRAAASFGPLIGVIVASLLALFTLLGIWQLRGASGGDRVLWLLVTLIASAGAVGVVYLLASISTIRYVLGDEALT